MCIEIISLIFNVLTSIVVVYLAYLALKHTAKPKIQIDWVENNQIFNTATDYTLTFKLSNIGHWYGKPAAKNIIFFFAFLPPVELMKLRFGSALEKESDIVFKGKGDSSYLRADGIYLMFSEPPEKALIFLKTPNDNGKYNFWITACSDDGVFDIYRYQLVVDC